MQAVIRVFFAAVFLIVVGCTTTQMPDTQIPKPKIVKSEPIPETIYFLGLAGEVYSTGMYEMQEVTGGTVLSWAERYALQKQIVAAHKAGKLKSYRFKIVGHSLGGNSANWLANALVAEGMKVVYVATLDATDPQPVDKRIKKADNFMSRDFRARLVPGSNEIDRRDLNHIQLDNDLEVQSVITEAIEEANAKE
jgi:hypothetical protein